MIYWDAAGIRMKAGYDPRELGAPVTTKTAADFMRQGIDVMEARAKEYGAPAGERSMALITQIFNLYTGHTLTEAEGWQFMEILKNVRQAAASEFHEDSLVDGLNYGALKGEAKAREGTR